MSEKNKEQKGANTNTAEETTESAAEVADTATVEELKKADPISIGISREEFLEALARLEKSNEGQEKYAKKQYYMSLISAFASVGGLIIVIYIAASLLPRIDMLLTDINSTMTNVIKITDDLAKVDMQEMANNIDSLVATTEQSIGDAMGKLLAIDFEGLNEAIQDLGAIIAPLSRLFGGR